MENMKSFRKQIISFFFFFFSIELDGDQKHYTLKHHKKSSYGSYCMSKIRFQKTSYRVKAF